MYIRYSIFVTKNLLTRGAIYRPRPPYVNLHLRIICIFDFLRRPSWSVANRTVKGDRLCYDSIATYIYIYIHFLITYEMREGKKKKEKILCWFTVKMKSGTKRKVSIEILERIYIYIYDCFVSQFAIIAIWYNIIKVMIIIGTWNISG